MSDTAHTAASQTDKNIKRFNPPKTAPIDVARKLETLPMISRAQDLMRNNGVAAGALNTIVDNVVGTGLRLNTNINYKALDRTKEETDAIGERIEALWQTYAESTDIDARGQWNFHGLTQLVAKAHIQSGEAFAIPEWNEDKNKKFRTCFLVIEPEHVCNPEDKENTTNLKDGIEVNKFGGPVAYHVAKRHPNECTSIFSSQKGLNTWKRVPKQTKWGRKLIIHLFTANRPGQLRGVPAFASSLKRFAMLDNYEESELQAACVNAMIAAVVETLPDSSYEDIEAMFSDGTEGEGFTNYLLQQSQQDRRLTNGRVLHTLPGEKVTSFDTKRPNAKFGDFVDTVLKHIAASFNLPVELLTKDFRDSSYSSARTALLEAWRTFKRERTHLAVYWAKEVYALWLEEVISKGLIENVTLADFYANKNAWVTSEWIGPGKGWIDPVKEAQGSVIRINNNLSTFTKECAEQGEDFNDIVEVRVREMKKIKETAEANGLTLEEVYPAFSQVQINPPSKDEGDEQKKDEEEDV